MAPYEIRHESLSALRRTIQSMLSESFRVQLRKESDQVKLEWADTLLRCDLARDRLELAELKKIRDDLRANENDFRDGAARLTESVRQHAKAAQVLEAAARFVKLLTRVAALGL